MSTNDPAPKRQKRSYDEMDPAPALFSLAPPRVFGANLSFPFRFKTPAPTPAPTQALLTQGGEPARLGGGYGDMATRAFDGALRRREHAARAPNPVIHNHIYPPHVPQLDMANVLRGYLNLLIYLAIILFMIYIFRGDLEQSIAGRRLDVVQEITLCAKDYKNNLCAINPIPAMALQCATWETCMNQDPTLVGRLKVGAGIITETVNSFVEPITGKTAVFILTLPLILLVFKKLFS